MGWVPRAVVAVDFGAYGSGFAWTAGILRNEDPLTRAIHFFPGHAAVRPGLFSVDGPLSLADRDRVGDLLTSYLGEARTAALAHVTATGAYAEGEIRWCITIPAIWDEPEKTALLRAAYDAGFPADEDRLLLLIEPEAAALFCRLRMAELADGPGRRFIVVNLGSGTVDVAAYEYSGKRRPHELEEIGAVSSGTLGRFSAGRDEAEALLETVAAGIVAKVEDQLAGVRRTSGHGPGRETIIVLGGIVLSSHLNAALCHRLGSEHRILVAPDPGLAVLEGAVHYTCNPRALTARRSRYTYGFAVAMPWEAGVDSPLRKFSDTGQQVMCRDRFAVAVHRMDRVAVDEPVTILVEPAFADSPEVTVQLFKTRAADPRYVDEDGCELAGELTVDVSDTMGQAERPIEVLLYFGRSRIQVEAIDLTTNKRFETATDYINARGELVMAGSEDLGVLTAELRELKSQLLAEASESAHIHTVTEIESARRAAEISDEAALLRHLKAAGEWALDVAERRDMTSAADALKAALNLPG
jgi:hypothetical protein